MNTDPIADLLTRIRNAISAHHQKTTVPYSKIKEGILRILKDKGFIENFEIKENNKFKELEITLKEDRSDLTIKRISKPGQRIYARTHDLKMIKSGLGMQILSTSKGLMTNFEAKKQKLGGEVLCEIY